MLCHIKHTYRLETNYPMKTHKVFSSCEATLLLHIAMTLHHQTTGLTLSYVMYCLHLMRLMHVHNPWMSDWAEDNDFNRYSSHFNGNQRSGCACGWACSNTLEWSVWVFLLFLSKPSEIKCVSLDIHSWRVLQNFLSILRVDSLYF